MNQSEIVSAVNDGDTSRPRSVIVLALWEFINEGSSLRIRHNIFSFHRYT